ncbi:MAG TPA: MBL fold metallo-hydrolase [Kiritimatiellia bacterium]|nr:MBL fold metallo-hydrolase [Kiritimatiellia bacterium]
MSGDATTASRFVPIARHGDIEVFLWTDVCNVYVLRDGDTAMLIDIGDGSVLDRLGDIGVRRLEWVLLTHHHREQCQGHGKLRDWQSQVAAPEKERALLERPTEFRKARPALEDPFTTHGASFVRPPLDPLTVQRGFKTMDTFTWRGCEFWCVETAGNSPGSMSYLLNTAAGWLTFSGDVMLAGARMHTWFDTEWDYGFAKGLYTLIESASLLQAFEPTLLLPSHGPVIGKPTDELKAYQQKLRRLAQLYVRGYSIATFEGADQDTISRPSAVPHLWQTTPHLFKFKGPCYLPNATFLVADSGRALMIDCGLVDEATLDATIEQMQQRIGLKGIDALLVTHMHGDHVLGAAHLRERWGAKLWTLDRVAPPLEQPDRFDYAAQLWSYDRKVKPLTFDRLFTSGERFTWEGYELTVDWMPGQTEFACCVHGMIDGRRVAFTGDNIFGDPENPHHDGHEAVCCRNSAILEEGYIYAAEYLRRLKPDLLMGGHSFVMDRPGELIERYHRWSLELRESFRALSAEEDYRTMFDPYWVRVDPYRMKLARGGSGDATLVLRNFLSRSRAYRVGLRLPDGVSAERPVLEGSIPAESTIRVPFHLRAHPDRTPGVCFIPLDVTMDGHRHGEWFDFIVEVGAEESRA